jgi:hypothetical protein
MDTGCARVRLLLSILPATLLLAGCAGVGGAGYGSDPPDSASAKDPTSEVIASSRDSATAPADFRDRTTLPSCGDFELGQGESLPANAVDCLKNAGEEGAELAFSQPTTEGDPIVYFYRVGPADAGVELFIDGTKDSYGSGEWTNEVFVDGAFDWAMLP